LINFRNFASLDPGIGSGGGGATSFSGIRSRGLDARPLRLLKKVLEDVATVVVCFTTGVFV
jgi:hypothetical protein